MPLVKLQSDLVWRGPKPNFTPDTPIPNDSESRFIPPKAGKGAPMTPGLAVKPPVVRVEGIGVNGRPYFIKYITAKDDFPTKNSMFDMGIAKRSAQGGEGYPFPKSYKGEIYQWKPEPHTGFYETNRYEDLAVPSGDRRGFLRETYLSNTPIEDVYNRFNLREDSYNSSYIKEPYILRGIQREGSIDPQRWGGTSTSVIDFPRSGFASYSDRASNDVLRISKFLASPKGISFLVTQFGLQLMNPNVENAIGEARTPFANYPSNTKTFLPINLLANTAASGLGIRLPRHGILGKGSDGTYEEVIKTRGNGGLATNFNRLVKLRDEILKKTTITIDSVFEPGGAKVIPTIGESVSTTIVNPLSIGASFKTLSGATGPKSFLGVGLTEIRRFTNSKVSFDGKDLGNIYNIEAPYTVIIEDKPDNNLSRNRNTYPGPNSAVVTDKNSIDYTGNNRLAKRLDSSLKITDYSPGNTRIANNNVDSTYPGFKNNPNTGENGLVQKYSTLSYGQVRKAASVSTKKNNFIAYLDDQSKAALKRKYVGKLETEELSKNIRGNTTDLGTDDNKNGFDDDNGIIKFRFAKYPGGAPVYFRAYLSSINDRFGPQWEAEKLQNSAFNRYMYNAFDRSISISFVVTVESRDELEPVYKKLKNLANLTMPILSKDNPPLGNFVEVTIGDLFVDEVMLIDSLSYSIDNETPWEIEADKQAPKYITVDVDFTYIGKRLSCADSPVYSINTVE